VPWPVSVPEKQQHDILSNSNAALAFGIERGIPRRNVSIVRTSYTRKFASFVASLVTFFGSWPVGRESLHCGLYHEKPGQEKTKTPKGKSKKKPYW